MNTALKLEKLDLPQLPDACASCAHFRSQLLSGVALCAAFPKRIPAEVMAGRNLHRKPIAGDHGIQWQRHAEWGSATPESIAAFDAAIERGELPTG
ncbi:MAG: hypothetical protein SGI99_15460 [Pseudomonadota bacterium]|nr:hypothetical protein [Pseudomonadota bacterium]